MLVRLFELFCGILKVKNVYLFTLKENSCHLLMIFNLKLSIYIELWRNASRELMGEIIASLFES